MPLRRCLFEDAGARRNEPRRSRLRICAGRVLQWGKEVNNLLISGGSQNIDSLPPRPDAPKRSPLHSERPLPMNAGSSSPLPPLLVDLTAVLLRGRSAEKLLDPVDGGAELTRRAAGPPDSDVVLRVGRQVLDSSDRSRSRGSRTLSRTGPSRTPSNAVGRSLLPPAAAAPRARPARPRRPPTWPGGSGGSGSRGAADAAGERGPASVERPRMPGGTPTTSSTLLRNCGLAPASSASGRTKPGLPSPTGG